MPLPLSKKVAPARRDELPHFSCGVALAGIHRSCKSNRIYCFGRERPNEVLHLPSLTVTTNAECILCVVCSLFCSVCEALCCESVATYPDTLPTFPHNYGCKVAIRDKTGGANQSFGALGAESRIRKNTLCCSCDNGYQLELMHGSDDLLFEIGTVRVAACW